MRSLTKAEKIKELKRCKDPSYFIKNYVYIKHPSKGHILFSLFDFQTEALDDFINHRFNIILKSRQLGLSTLISAYSLWMILFHRNKNIAIASIKQDDSKDVIEKIKYGYEFLPEWMKIAQIKIDNRFALELTNGSMVRASSTTKNIARGQALSLLIIDEAAFIEGLEDSWAAAWPTVQYGRAIINSTPNGSAGFYYDMWTGAINKENDFNPIKLMWDVHPDRDERWKETTKKNMSEKKWAQEYACSFLMSGDTVISPKDISRLRDEIKEPIKKSGFRNCVWTWENFSQTHTYLMAVDVSTGFGEDYSAFWLVRLDDMKLCVECKIKTQDMDLFVDLITDTAYDYGTPVIAVENAGLGLAVIEKLINRNYDYIYYHTKSTHEFVPHYEAYARSDVMPGFSTTNKTRPLLIARLEEFIRTKTIISNSERYVRELENFVFINGKPQARKGKNDDLVMCSAMISWLRDQILIIANRDIEYKKQYIQSFKKRDHKFTGWENTKKTEPLNIFKFQGSDGKMHDLTWLLKK